MTIISARHGVMACDSCWNDNDLVVVLATKLEKLPSGAIIGMAGDSDGRELVALCAHVKTEKSLPTVKQLAEIRSDTKSILMFPNGDMWVLATSRKQVEHDDYEVGIWKIAGVPYAAVGSGADIAMGAFFKGATAAEAAQAACKHDINCRLPIHTMTILQKKLSVVKPKRKNSKKHV